MEKEKDGGVVGQKGRNVVRNVIRFFLLLRACVIPFGV